MKLTMLGTGNALVTECFNTCFLMEDEGRLFMVDGGGGNVVLHQIRHAGYDWMDIRHIFVTHKHIDHLLGIIWMVRMICQFMNHGEYRGDACIYSHGEVLDLIRDMAGKLLRRIRWTGHPSAVCAGRRSRPSGRTCPESDSRRSGARSRPPDRSP